MSSIASVPSPTNPFQTVNQNSVNQFVTDFNAIGSALQSGDISSAQSALATFQQDLPANSLTSANQPFGSNAKANTDYQSLVSALKSGDVSNAQKAFTNLQTDLKATHKGHHHHHHGSGVTADTIPPSATTSSSAAKRPTSSANTIATNPVVDSDGDNDGSGLNVTA
jgi:hypothetical protein